MAFCVATCAEFEASGADVKSAVPGVWVGDFFCPVNVEELNMESIEEPTKGFIEQPTKYEFNIADVGGVDQLTFKPLQILPAVDEGNFEYQCEVEEKEPLDEHNMPLKAQLQCKGQGLGLLPATEEIVTLRQIFKVFKDSPVGASVDVALINWAKNESDKFKVFDSKRGFSGAVREIMTGDRSAGDAKNLLRELMEVAESFIPMGHLSPKNRDGSRNKNGLCWSRSLGKQYFILCKNIVEWNMHIFHPDLKALTGQIKTVADEGKYSFDGVDLRVLVTEVLTRYRSFDNL